MLFIPFGSNRHFCISQPFQGRHGELRCSQSFPSELLVVTSLTIFKNNASHNHFNLSLSIIMTEGDRLSFTQEGTVRFSSLRVASTLSVSSNCNLDLQLCKEVDVSFLFFFFNALRKLITISPKKRLCFFSLSNFLSFTAVC